MQTHQVNHPALLKHLGDEAREIVVQGGRIKPALLSSGSEVRKLPIRRIIDF